LFADDREPFPGDEEDVGPHDEPALAIQHHIDRRDRHAFSDDDAIVCCPGSRGPMTFLRINGSDDPRVAEYRTMSDAELVRAHGLFVAEGRLRLRSVLVSDAAAARLAPALAQVERDVPIFVCEAGDFLGITGHDMHRGCLALVERPATLAPDEVLRGARIVVILEGVTNADNVGGVFRNAAAFGAAGVLLSPTCCDPLYRKAIRTSMAATLRVPFARVDDWPDALSRVRAAGFSLVALTPREPSHDLDAFASSRAPSPTALLVGTEGAGLTAEAEAAADYRVRIPMRREVDSLNLAVATGIALYRLSFR
jgi:tRNA G18 (ribose-2'-O)-methylase SpoU